MKALVASVVFLIVLIVIGCGGGGGGGGTTNTTSTTATTSTTSGIIKMVAASSPGVFIDPTNLQPGDTVTFQLVSFDPTTFAPTQLTGSGFNTTDTTGRAGVLNHINGSFMASGPTGSTQYTVSTTYNGTTYSTNYAVTPVQARLTGTVQDNNGAAVPFAGVLFFDSNGNQVGSCAAAATGQFLASIPTTAVRFNLNSATLSTATYFRLFAYGTGTYSPLNTACSAPLPSPLTKGQTSALTSAAIVFATANSSGVANTPPAPPTCSP